MSDDDGSSPDGEAPGSLTEYLDRLARSPVRAPDRPQALVDAAAALAKQTLGPSALAALDGDDRAAATLAVRARARAIHDYWKPLLPLCREGRSPAPVGDLKSVAAQAEALAKAATGDDKAKLDDVVFRMRGWLPTASSAHLQAAKFDAPVAHRPAPPPPKPKPAPVAAAPSRYRGLMVVVLLVLLAGAGISSLLNRPPPPASLTDYQAAVTEVLDKRVEGDALIVVVSPDWLKQDQATRLEDLDALEATIGGEPINRIVVQAPDGRRFAELSPQGATLLGG